MRAIAVLLFATAGWSANFSGIWTGEIPVGRFGAMQEVAFKLVQTGKTVTGKLYGDYRSTPISDAVVYSDLITFVVVAQEQAGNQINETRLRFTGRLEPNGELELTRERESSTNAGNAGAAQIRFNTKQTFRLKRLL